MRRIDGIVGCGILLIWAVLVAVWAVDVSGSGLPAIVSKICIVIALVATTASVVYGVWRLCTESGGSNDVGAGRILLALVICSVVLNLIGIDFEVSGRYYRDEGIYYAAAEDLNQGRLLPESFIYGHFPYYVYAVALWVQSLFPQAIGWLTNLLYGTHKEVEVSWLLLRSINAGMGALTTIPVFVIGFRVAGLIAGSLGALLIIFSPIYTEISRLIISDVPSAFFATLSLMFVSFLLKEERWAPYVLAGVAAGLAAASKYPAGVVVVAIVAIWSYWRLRKRDWSWTLVGSGLVSLATFLMVMPAIWAHSGNVFVGQGKDMLFGLRQYGRGGWIGVMPGSNIGWYGKQLLTSFGLPALLLGVTGWPWLSRESKRRFGLMLAFPVVFLVLLAMMSMVVKRNLLPALPALAALLGIGAAGWTQLVERRLGRRDAGSFQWVTTASVGLLVLALPLVRTGMQTTAFARPSTRDQASDWIQQNVPWGARFIQESYTPHLHFKKYPSRKSRFAARIPLEEIQRAEWDYLLLAQNAYGRFIDPDNWAKPHHEVYANRYEQMLAFDLAADFPPTGWRQGPYVRLFKIDPPNLEYSTAKRVDFDPEPYLFPKEGAFLLLKEYLASGSYELRVETEPPATEGSVRIVTRENQAVGEFPLTDKATRVQLAWNAKYFLYLYFPNQTRLRWLEIQQAGDDGA